MFTVGLTGGIGAGKSTVADLFAALGVPVVDTDVIARQLTAPGGEALDDIRAVFGASMIQADGGLDRAAMRRLVFADAGARGRLEALLHPRIRDAVRRALAAIDARYVLVAIPLLVETGACRDAIDRVLVVDCPEALQIERVMARSRLTRAEAEAILAAQATRAQRLAAADDVIDNTHPPAALHAAVAALHARYLALSAATLP